MGQFWKPAFKKAKRKSTWQVLHPFKHGNTLRLMDQAHIGEPIMWDVHSLIWKKPTQIVWAGDYNEDGKYQKLYFSNEYTDTIPQKFDAEKLHYLVNKTKNLYIVYDYLNQKSTDIDALAILCAECNGLGGGDYFGENMELAGTWAGDVFYTTDKLPKNCTEYKPNFEI